MPKATKRVDAEAADTASAPDASPPKKSKSRTKAARELAPLEVRLPRAAKTKALMTNYLNAEVMKKTKSHAESAVKKTRSAEDMSPKPEAGMKRSQSAVDVNLKEREPPAKKGKAVAANKPEKKPAPKLAGAKVKPKRGARKDEGAVESENGEGAKQPEDGETEETTRPPAKAEAPVTTETKEKKAPKKRAAAVKKTTRGREKNSAATDEEKKHYEDKDDEIQDVAEEAKLAKGKKGKTVIEAKPGRKMLRGRKTAPNVDSQVNEINGNAEENEEVVKDTEKTAKEVKPAKGRKGKASAAPAKMPRGKKAAPVVEEREPEEDYNLKRVQSEIETDIGVVSSAQNGNANSVEDDEDGTR